MRTPLRRLIFNCVCLLIASVSPVFAQDEPLEFKLPCPEVLKLGLDKFVEAYGEKTKDYSTLGQKLAFNYYVDCKKPVNNKSAAQLSDTRRKQVDDVRTALSQIGNASWSIAYTEAGGGTMYSLASVSAYAVREDVMGTVITEAMVERKLPAARRRANLYVAKARRDLPSATRPPTLEHWGEESRVEQLKRYRDDVALIRSAVSRLEVIIRILPDKAAATVARRMADELDAGLEE